MAKPEVEVEKGGTDERVGREPANDRAGVEGVCDREEGG